MLTKWIEENIPEGLAVFVLPGKHRKRMRTTNMLERLHEEIKRRTRVARLFPNEASLLRLVSAIEMEISEEWFAGKRYLDMNVEMESEGESDDSKEKGIYRKMLLNLLNSLAKLSVQFSELFLPKPLAIWSLCRVFCHSGFLSTLVYMILSCCYYYTLA